MSGFVGIGGAGIIGGIRAPFVTTLYNGTGAAQDIVTGVNNAAGSLVWIKRRNAFDDNRLFNTSSGANKFTVSNRIDFEQTTPDSLTSFNSDGFSVGSAIINAVGGEYVAWSFLETAGFFDMVSYTGDGVQGRVINHDLGAEVGLMAVKRLDNSGAWTVYHRMLNGGVSPGGAYVELDNDKDEVFNINRWNNTAPTSTQFTVGNAAEVNGLGNLYRAYLFAHNPSKYISCGGFTSAGALNDVVNVGWRPRWLLIKKIAGGVWRILDRERGDFTRGLFAHRTQGESDFTSVFETTDTGFIWKADAGTGNDYIYVAIR